MAVLRQPMESPHQGWKVLVVEDDEHVRFGVSASLRAARCVVREAATCVEAIRTFRQFGPDVVVTDLRLPDGNSVDLLPKLLEHDPTVPVFIVTGYGTIDVAVAAVKLGAEDFLTKPVDVSRLVALVDQAASRRFLRRSSPRAVLRPALSATPSPPPPSVRSGSRKMQELEHQIERLRDADCSVLILGETGTGKSVLARRLHQIGARATGPFVDVNCAGLTREFVESELFGHERGAYTGAHTQKAGLFEAAHQGTLFLDEIGDIDIQVQPKVLKAIEEKRFRRMGDVREREVDVRLIAATHHDLLSAVEEKGFRGDLYYRISTFTLHMPALRERTEDILSLAREMLDARGASDVEIAEGARDKLLGYAWPGNLRELKNVVERALVLRRGERIEADDVHVDVRPPPARPSRTSSPRLLAAEASTATRGEIEREHILVALDAENGRVEAAARRLGMPRSTLYFKLKQLGIAVNRARGARGEREPEEG